MAVPHAGCSTLGDESGGTSPDQPVVSCGKHPVVVFYFQSDDPVHVAERRCGGPVCPSPAACGIGCVGGRAEGCPEYVFLAPDHAVLHQLYRISRTQAILAGASVFYSGPHGQADAGDAALCAAPSGSLAPEPKGPFSAVKTDLGKNSPVVFSMLTMATWLQAGHWRNSITLFEHALEVTSDNYVAYNNLGNALAVRGRLDEAIERFAAAIQIRPNNPRSLNNMGAALMLKGENEKAIHLFKRALEIRPDYTDALKNLERVKGQPGLIDSNAIL